MKTKKTVIAVLTAALLISAALILGVVGCASPMGGASVNPGSTADKSTFQIPAGKGVIRFNISDKNARTIMPDADSLELEDMFFQVIFTADSGNSANDKTLPVPGNPYISYASLTDDPIVMAAGDSYDIQIIAFNQSAVLGSISVAGWSSDAPIAVNAADTTTVNADLIAYVNELGVGSGSFSYSVAVPDMDGGYDTCEMVITAHSSNYNYPTPLEIPLVVDDTTADVVPLPAGYYTVKVTVAKAKYRSEVIVQALQVYPAMTSTWTPIVVPALIKNVLDITFNLGVVGTNVSNPSGTFDALVRNYGTSFPSALVVAPVPTGAYSGYSFAGWYTNSTFSGSVFTPPTRVLTDTALYAKYTPPGTPNAFGVNITFTFGDKGSTVLSSTYNSISRGDFDGGETITLTLAAPSNGDGGGTWSNIKWTLSDLDFTTPPLSSHVINSGTNLVINNSEDFHPVLNGDITVHVMADLSGNTKPNGNGPYSASITITVTD